MTPSLVGGVRGGFFSDKLQNKIKYLNNKGKKTQKFK